MLKDTYIMKTIADLTILAKEALVESLSRVPFVRIAQIEVEPQAYRLQPDLVLKLELPDGEITLVAEIKSSGEPRVTRSAVDQLRKFQQMFPRSYGIFIAPYISPASADILTEQNIGYLDLAGNCLISFWPIYISREGSVNPFIKKRPLRSLYSPKASRILRVLLTNGRRTWLTEELAREASVSLGLVANIKKILEDREWVSSRRVGLQLTDPEALLNEWAANYKFSSNKQLLYYSLDDTSTIESRLADISEKESVQYALTGFSGAARLAPFVRYQRAMFYISSQKGLDKIVEQLNLKPVSSGANVTALLPYDEGVFYGSQLIDQSRITSPIQIYLDLQKNAGRGEEAADFLLESVIKPKWR